MKHCDYCNMDINTDKPYCPLCYGELDGENSTNLVYKTKDKLIKKVNGGKIVQNIFLYISICLLVVSFFVNFLTSKDLWWSFIILFGVIYVWILVRHTIISRRSIFEKILFQFLGVCAILFFTSLISGGGEWLFNYVIPSVALVTSIVTLILCFSITRNNHLSSFFLLFILMLISSIILILTKLDSFKLLNQINVVLNTLIILGILIFRFKALKQSIQKTFNM